MSVYEMSINENATGLLDWQSSSSMKGALQIQTQWQEVNVNENRDKQWIAEHQS